MKRHSLILSFLFFNGSGFPIQIGNKITGRAALRSPLMETIEMMWDENEVIRRIHYPGHGTFIIRQFLSEGAISEAQAHAESPAVRSIDRMFDGVERPPTILFTFKEVKISANAISDDEMKEFFISLPDYVEVPY